MHPGPLTLKKLDLPGFAIFVPFSIMMLLALQWGGNEHAWTSPMILGLLGGAVGVFIIFAAWEYRAGYGAMIPYPVLKKREIWSSCLTCLVLVASVICTAYYLAIYFQTARDASPFQGGIDMLPGILAQLLSAVFAGGFSTSIPFPFSPFLSVPSSANINVNINTNNRQSRAPATTSPLRWSAACSPVSATAS